MKTLSKLLLVMSLLSSVTIAAQEGTEMNMTGETVVDLDQVNCKQAYEKAHGKKHHKRLFHKASTRNKASKRLNVQITKEEVERAIEYGYRTGAYCKQGHLLSNKDFKEVTIAQVEAIKAADKLGTKLESLETGIDTMSCRDYIKMADSNKEDGHNRNVLGLKSDLHNIYDSYEKEKNGTELKTQADLKLEKKRSDYLRRVRRKAVDELDDDSISMADVHKAMDSTVEDGSACAGDKVLSRSKMKDLLIHRLSDKSQRAESVNSDGSNLERDIQVYFNNGGTQSMDLETMKEGSDA